MDTAMRSRRIDMDDDKRIDEWLENHDGDDYCHYCNYGADCDGRGVRG